MPDREALLVLLLEDGWLVLEAGRLRTTRRWRGAMARAAGALQRSGAPWRDLRLPIALALAARYGSRSDEELADLIELMLPVEERTLPSLFGEDAGALDE